MNQAVKEYRKKTVSFFQCDSKHRKKLVQEMDTCLAPLLDDVSEPDLQTLTDALGPPEALAKELMEEIPPQEVCQYKQRIKMRKWTGICLAVVLVAVVLAVSVYAVFLKETRYFVAYDTISIDDVHESTEDELSALKDVIQ